MKRPNFVSLCLATLWIISLILHHPHLGRSHPSPAHIWVAIQAMKRDFAKTSSLFLLKAHPRILLWTALIMSVLFPLNTPPWMIFTFPGPLWIPFLRINFNRLMNLVAIHLPITRTRLPIALISLFGSSWSGFAIDFWMGRK